MSWRQWRGRRRGHQEPTGQPEPTAYPELVEHVQRLVRPGFLRRTEVLERVRDDAADLPGRPDAAVVDRVVHQVWAERMQEEQSWRDQGDHARLSAAFRELRDGGVTARMNFACCQNCGHTEIEDHRGPGDHGYVFFHQQDSEGLAEPDTVLRLAFSYFDDHPARDAALAAAARTSTDPSLRARAREQHERLETAVGVDVVDVLRRHGLGVDWAGTGASRPAVHITEWRRPLPR